MKANEETPNLTGTTTSFLLKLVTDEIARDGGACLATTLKDYIVDSQKPLESNSTPQQQQQRICCYKSKKRRNQQLNSLLVHSNVGKPKLLAFLESHPTVFSVRRTVIPHWVQLVEAQPPSSNWLSTQAFPQKRESLQSDAFQKALYVLRKRQARIDRRKTKTKSPNTTTTDVSDTTTDGRDEGVFLHWLLRQCCWEFHFLLRHCGFYTNQGLCGYRQPSDVKPVGTREWEAVVLPVFEAFLGKARERDVSNNQNNNTYSWIRVWKGKAWLEKSSLEEEHQEQQQFDDETAKFDFIVRPAAEGGSDPSECEEKIQDIDESSCNHLNEEDAMLNLVRRIDQTLTDIVCRKDGGHQVSLSLLLHRHPDFKELLGGRDLWSLYCEFSKDDPVKVEKNDSSFFSSISMFYNGPNLILRSKQSKTMDGNDGVCNEKRMMVDEEGLYSVTNNKWGRAMSNLVIQACRQKNLFGDEEDSVSPIDTDTQEGNRVTEESKSESTPKTMIDLTASVGGMTLGLAKANYFDRVIALEIDQGRAALCKENLNRHGFYNVPSGSTKSIVEVRNQDSVKQIPFLPRGACFVIDPPWGGYDYKQMVRRHQAEGSQGLKLGGTSLENVLGLMGRHNSPCVVGLRLPTNFAAKDFLHALRETHQDIEFECLTRRKISVQLFMVIYFPPQTECV